MTLLEIKQKKQTAISDCFNTPDWPIISLVNALPKPLEGLVWDPCCGKGNIVNLFHRMNQPSYGSDITVTKGCPDWMECRDFLKTNVNPDTFQYIITNPPYSLKDEFLAKCYSYNKPFALLLPITALGEQARFKMYKEHGIQVVLLPKRVNYETPSGEGSGAHFSTAWFTHGFNFEKDIIYATD